MLRLAIAAFAGLVAVASAACTWTAAYPLPPERADAARYPRLGPAPSGAPARADSAALLAWHRLAMRDAHSGPPIGGNSARLLIDGPATYAAMFAAIQRARRSIDLQSYIFEDDEIGRKIAALLQAQRARGVTVNLLYDAVGSIGTPTVFFEALRKSGVDTCEFNPVNPMKGRARDPNHRNHRKILVVDGEVAFTGGINVSSVYSRGSAALPRSGTSEDRTRSGWRDTQIEIRGPAVRDIERIFEESWSAEDCERAPVRAVAAARRPIGDKWVKVIASSPRDPVNDVYVALLSALRAAQRSIAITMAYFVPDQQTIDILRAAAQRGVDVRLILPGFSDFGLVLDAGRARYQALLDAGVRIYERNDALLHAKTITVDGVWSMVGSANMDWRSFIHNDEVTVVVLGPAFASEMESVFAGDLRRSTPVDAESWARRGLSARAREWWARIWEYWL